MTAFLAITRLTCRSAVRSHVFRFLLIVLTVGVLVIPNTIKGDGSAYGFIQVSLEYSLSFISVMLMMSAIWLGCQTMTQDVEDSRIHLITAKPVPRPVIWLGKLTGVVAILTALLAITSVIVYAFVTWQYGKLGIVAKGADKSPSSVQSMREQRRIRDEVLTGRRVYMPEKPDIDKLADQEFQRKMAETTPDGKRVLNLATPEQRKMAMDSIRRQIVASLCEVKPGMVRYWVYKNLPESCKDTVFLRYKAFSGMMESSSNTQPTEMGAWGAVVYYNVKPDPADLKPGQKPEPVRKAFYVSRPPEQILCQSVNELAMPGEQIVNNGEAVIGFSNLGKTGKPMFFQMADGPKLLIRTISFTNNYFRAVLMEFLAILAVSVIAVSAASFLSMPVAVFFSVSYLAFGSFSLYLIGAKETFGDNMPLMDRFGYYLGNILLSSVIPVQKFDISDSVANGEMIEMSMVGMVFLFQILLKGLPIALLCMWLYNRRELALASTKR